MLPEPSAVRVVVPDTFVLPTTIFPLVPAVIVRLSVPAVSVPVVDRVPAEAESFTVSVPVPTFEVWTVVDIESVTDVVPEVAVALTNPAFVLKIVAPPVPLFSDSVPVLTAVAAVCDIEPVPSAVRVVVPDTFVLPTITLPLLPAEAVRVRPPAVTVPVVVIDPPAAESLTVSVPVPMLEVCTVTEAESVTDVAPDVALAFKKPALVLEITAPPVPVLSESVPVATFVAAT
jgi:hypothetical protein